MECIPRGLPTTIETAWRETPIVVLEGLRATGKTTLAKSLAPKNQFYSFADVRTRERVFADTRTGSNRFLSEVSSTKHNWSRGSPWRPRRSLRTTLNDPTTESNPGVPWWGLSELDITSSYTPTKLINQARVADGIPDSIDWLVRLDGAVKNDFGGSFTTAWNEDPRLLIEERLGRFADELPDFVSALTPDD